MTILCLPEVCRVLCIMSEIKYSRWPLCECNDDKNKKVLTLFETKKHEKNNYMHAWSSVTEEVAAPFAPRAFFCHGFLSVFSSFAVTYPRWVWGKMTEDLLISLLQSITRMRHDNPNDTKKKRQKKARMQQ